MNITELLTHLDPMIEHASEHAYEYFSSKNISHEFEGCKLDMTRGLCKQIYSGLVEDLVAQNSPFGIRNGLTAFMLIKRGKNDRTTVMFNFGILFCKR